MDVLSTKKKSALRLSVKSMLTSMTLNKQDSKRYKKHNCRITRICLRINKLSLWISNNNRFTQKGEEEIMKKANHKEDTLALALTIVKTMVIAKKEEEKIK